MLSLAQHERLARKCTTTFARAIDSLPGLLENIDQEAAARIIADLIKIYVAGPFPEPDPGAALSEVIRAARAETDAEQANQPAQPWRDTYQPPALRTQPDVTPEVAQVPSPPTSEHSDIPSPYEAQILSSPSRTCDD